MNWVSRGSEPPISFPTLNHPQRTLVQNSVKLGEVPVPNNPAPGSQEVALKQNSLSSILADQTKRALWEVQNVISCVPSNCWDKEYCQAPLWKHIYHMLHSLDLWLINPRDSQFKEPPFHEKNLNDLDTPSCKQLGQCEINRYFCQIQNKITDYLHTLQDDALLEKPQGSEYTRFTLILAQHRHLHTHMGMIMGFIIAETGLWPKVIGLEGEIPSGGYEHYF